jgi:hypothetical protein
MAYTVDITDDQIFTALRSWLLDLMPSGVLVVQGLQNLVPMPLDPAIAMTSINKIRLATNEHLSFYNPNDQVPENNAIKTTIRLEHIIQLDVLGDGSSDNASAITTFWRDEEACAFLLSSGLQPLYCDDPKLMPIINGASQWEDRWMIQVHMQYNQTFIFSQEFANEAAVTLVNVEATYPI